MRRINPIANEADDIVRVVRRLEDAIRALHQVADLLPLLLADADAEPSDATTSDTTTTAESASPVAAHTVTEDTAPGKEDRRADTPGEPDDLHRGPGAGGSPPAQ